MFVCVCVFKHANHGYTFIKTFILYPPNAIHAIRRWTEILAMWVCFRFVHACSANITVVVFSFNWNSRCNKHTYTRNETFVSITALMWSVTIAAYLWVAAGAGAGRLLVRCWWLGCVGCCQLQFLDLSPQCGELCVCVCRTKQTNRTF